MRRFVERHFELVAFTLVALFWGGIFYAGHHLDGDKTLLEVLKSNRVAVYAALAGLFGTIFGFAITAISILLGFAQSPKLVILRNTRHWPRLWSVFTRGIWILSGVAVAAVVGLIFDKDATPNPAATYAILFMVLMGVARLLLIAWAFEKLVFIMTRPEPREDVDWHREMSILNETVVR